MDLFEKGKKELALGKWKEARKSLEEATKLHPSAEVYEDLARACWWLNDIPAVLAFREEAYRRYLDTADNLGASRTASWLGIDFLELKGEFAVANGWFQRAEHLLENQPPSLELGLIKLLKGRKAFITDPGNENALALINESLQLNKSLGGTDVGMLAEALKGFILTTEGRIEEGMSLLDEATLIATTAATDINFITLTCCFLIEACERLRDFERAGQWCGKVKEICRRWEFDAMFSNCRNLYASVLICTGDWKEAEKELLTAREELKQYRPTYVNASTVRLADLRRRQGKWEETQSLLESAGAHSLKLLHCAALAFDMEDHTAAADFAERFLRQAPAKEHTRKIAGFELLVRIYCKQQRLDEAEPLLDALNKIAGEAGTVSLIAAAKSAEGIVAKSSGNLREAKQLLGDAIDLYDSCKAPYDAARTRLDLAETLTELAQYRLAESELNRALKTFQKLGAEKDAARAKTSLKTVHLDNAAMNALDKKLEFTGRELEVLRLIAEGKTNEEIAEALFLSVRTVEKHITNLYLKMGVSGKSARAFASSYAIRHHLVFS